MPIASSTSLDYLLEPLRLHLGDMTSPYRYLDEWLRVALVMSVISLQRWWSNKYTIDLNTYIVSPVILQSDETPILLMASILIKSGQLENNSWVVGSWRDAEYAVSNIEGNKSKEASLQSDWDKLLGYLTLPTKRLYRGERNSPPIDSLWTN